MTLKKEFLYFYNLFLIYCSLIFNIIIYIYILFCIINQQCVYIINIYQINMALMMMINQ